MTAADLVIFDLADGEAAAMDRVDELEHANAILRTMVSEGLRLLAHTTAQLEAARASINALRAAERRANDIGAKRPAA
jgi:hypothetical protein